jgi:hypothetical protein
VSRAVQPGARGRRAPAGGDVDEPVAAHALRTMRSTPPRPGRVP